MKPLPSVVPRATIGEGVQGKHAEESNAYECSLTDEKVAQIGLHQMDVKKIDLSVNEEITAVVAWAIIGKALQGKDVDELNVSNCRLTNVDFRCDGQL